jgi:hypothetical protein
LVSIFHPRIPHTIRFMSLMENTGAREHCSVARFTYSDWFVSRKLNYPRQVLTDFQLVPALGQFDCA